MFGFSCNSLQQLLKILGLKTYQLLVPMLVHDCYYNKHLDSPR